MWASLLDVLRLVVAASRLGGSFVRWRGCVFGIAGPAMTADDMNTSGDSTLVVEVNPPLPCGIRDCGSPAQYARIERDPSYAALWRLLPICKLHQAQLAAAAADIMASEDDSIPASASGK